jgi:hypothetical protein
MPADRRRITSCKAVRVRLCLRQGPRTRFLFDEVPSRAAHTSSGSCLA